MLQIRTRQASGRVLITTEHPSAPALTASATPHEPSSALPSLDVRTWRVTSPRNITPRPVNRRPRSPDIVPSSAGTVSPFAGWDELGKAIETVAYDAGAERAAARFAERAAAARGSSPRAGGGSRRSAAVRTLKLFVCGVEHSVLGHVLAALDLASSVAVVDRLQVRVLVIESQSAVSIQFQCSTGDVPVMRSKRQHCLRHGCAPVHTSETHVPSQPVNVGAADRIGTAGRGCGCCKPGLVSVETVGA